MKKILLINGPNLNLLGTREPDIYGHETLNALIEKLTARAKESQFDLRHIQSNHEGALIDTIQNAIADDISFIIINPAALTHTSIAMRDALSAVAIPFIEVHLSNIYQREPFRHHSYFSDIAIGTISGLGSKGYFLALDAAMSYLNHH